MGREDRSRELQKATMLPTATDTSVTECDRLTLGPSLSDLVYMMRWLNWLITGMLVSICSSLNIHTKKKIEKHIFFHWQQGGCILEDAYNIKAIKIISKNSTFLPHTR